MRSALRYRNLFFLWLVIFPAIGGVIIENAICASQEKGNAMHRGSWFSALFHRGTLRAYSAKINSGTITVPQLIDYLEKGGSVESFESYDSWHNFFVGSDDRPLLTYFINGPSLIARKMTPDRLDLLKLILQAHANPNKSGSSELGGLNLLAPVLYAAAGNDLAALKSLIQHGGDINLVETKYLGSYGPAITLVTEESVVNFLLEKGANLSYVDIDGRNLLQIALARSTSVVEKKKQVRWMLLKKVSPVVKDNAGKNAFDSLQAQIDWRQASLDRSIADAEEEITRIKSSANAGSSKEQNQIDIRDSLASAKQHLEKLQNELREDIAGLKEIELLLRKGVH